MDTSGEAETKIFAFPSNIQSFSSLGAKIPEKALGTSLLEM